MQAGEYRPKNAEKQCIVGCFAFARFIIRLKNGSTAG
jgi:hypothetical protein